MVRIKKAAFQAAPKKVRGLVAWRNLTDKADKHLVLKLYPEVQAGRGPLTRSKGKFIECGSSLYEP